MKNPTLFYFKDKLFSHGEFILPKELVKIGLYADLDEIRRAINRGDFSHIRVTRNRILIPTKEIFEFLKKSSM